MMRKHCPELAMSSSHRAGGIYPGLAPGCPVYTADGEQVGVVAEVQPTAFRLNVPGEAGYWLSTSSIRMAAIGRIKLAHTRAQLDAYKRQRPADE